MSKALFLRVCSPRPDHKAEDRQQPIRQRISRFVKTVWTRKNVVNRWTICHPVSSILFH